jgi:hypothetical protein
MVPLENPNSVKYVVDATKKATMKTIEFTRLNQTYNVIVVYGHTSI